MDTPDIVGMDHNFGAKGASAYTNFGENGPMGLWEESRTTQDFKGVYTPTGGSNPALGMSSWDDFGEHIGYNALEGGGPG